MWADRDVWLPYIDILKMNLEEASSTWLGESAELTADPPRLSIEELRDLAHHCLDRGVGAVCVTLDERGCVAFYRDGSGGVAEEFVDRIKVEHVVDTTGAGDSFAAGLAYGYLAYRDYVAACQYGNAMGAQRCTGAELTSPCHERKRSGRSSRRTALEHTRRSAMNADLDGEDSRWLIVEDGFTAALANTYETLFTTGNGYLGTRGSLEESHEGALPGTFLRGVFDHHDSAVIDLVKAPDWLTLAVVVNGIRLDVTSVSVVRHRRILDMREGAVLRDTVFEDSQGRRTRFKPSTSPAVPTSICAACRLGSPRRTTRRR